MEGTDLSLSVAGRVYQVSAKDEATYRVHQGHFWTDITFYPTCANEVKVDGLPNAQAATLVTAIRDVITERRICEDVAFLQAAQHAISVWLHQMRAQENAADTGRRWFTHEMQQALEDARPKIDDSAVRARLKRPGVRVRLENEGSTLKTILTLWELNSYSFWRTRNAHHTEHELESCKDLFDKVESKPLTDEQARAVVCFDNRVQVVASAGSGKTSIMVAKAAYAIERGFVAPERIVMLAFNNKAAQELEERVAKSFERLGMTGVKVRATTFHALGLSIIGHATGKKPSIPDWAIDTAEGLSKLNEIIDQLKDRSPSFRSLWDIFRLVFGRDLPAFGKPDAPDVWDELGNGRIRTARGESVRSQEEAMIANWLFMNGVDYTYEKPYPSSTANAEHRQYQPDFYYPGIDLYHEHFALDEQGQAPPDFKDYLKGVEWKRQLHQERGTSLFETTSHGIRNGNDLKRLEAALTQRGIALDPNPDRPIPDGGQKPMEQGELVSLVRTFISHAKSNCLTAPGLHQRMETMPTGTFKRRHWMFLDIVEPIMSAWDAALRGEDGIDFEDMLNLAAEHQERGRFDANYDLVMADEFQDASRARARLCRALVNKPGRFFFAVGDDWQSINRFAGADVSVMTDFQQWFGHGQILKLEQTFRCPQALCDVSGHFVSKNPRQIPKQMRSVNSYAGPVLQAFQVLEQNMLADAIDQFVLHLAQGVRDGIIPPGRNGKVSVYVLGRYSDDRAFVPSNSARFKQWVDISFLTIHRSKGSEADYVILPAMISALRGRSFPSIRDDDPVLAIAMPSGDDYPLSEERRLFYVALTRARRSVAMFTVRGQCSKFLRELEADGAVEIIDTEGNAVDEETCPSCKQGILIWREGKYGKFRSCSNFPACRYKPEKKQTNRASKSESEPGS